MTEHDVNPLVAIVLFCLALVIVGGVALYQNTGFFCSFRLHKWNKWEEDKKHSMTELYLVQRRDCKACGWVQLRSVKRPVVLGE